MENDFIIDNNIMYLYDSINFKNFPKINISDFYLLRVTNICYDEQAPKKEALENVLSSLKMNGINFLFLIVGRKEKVDFYYGISRDLNDCSPDFSIKDIGDSILMPSIQGNFRGSKVKALNPDERLNIINIIRGMPEVGVIEGVPGANKDDEKYQGIDRLINVMYGDVYCFMIVAKPLDMPSIITIQNNLYKFYDMKSPDSKKSIQTGTSKNTGKSTSTQKGTSKTNGSSSSNAKTTGESQTHTIGISSNTSKGESSGSSSYSTTESGSEGKSKSDANSTSSSETNTIGMSSSDATSTSETASKSVGESESTTTTIEYSKRSIQDFIKFMDDVAFPRLDYGKGKGMFLTSMCVFAQEKTALQKIKNTVTALYSGETGNKIPLQSFFIPKNAKESFKEFQLPYGNIKNKMPDDEFLLHFAMHHMPKKNGTMRLGNWITTNELGMIAGLPQKEVVGLSLNEEVEFGLNYTEPKNRADRIELGCLIQNGNELKESPVYLDKKDLDKHIFVSGVTGSGKTTTCQKILNDADIPFLVIEPAKTEYRAMYKNNSDIMIFTLGDNNTNPIKMNPLMFYPKENITSRVDMLCACIESAFDMEAAIPQIIEQALYKSYTEKGWDIFNNQNYIYDNPFDGSGKAFPTISDLIRNCKVVVDKQGFDDRLKNDYIGSINARLLGLTSGGKRFLLDTQSSVDFIDLLDHKVVFELENIRSSAEKSLIMGFILINLSEAIREKYQMTGKLEHITLVEEAHRLLSKHVPGDNPSKKQSVEMFSDMLAEIRKYGESLIIVDQIPNKLTPDVLKNTNTKIIHRIFAADDKEAVGNTVMLKNEQKDFLSSLPAGRAVYFSTGTEKAIQIQVKQSTDTSMQAPTNEQIKDSVIQYYIKNYARGLYQGMEIFTSMPTREQFECFSKINSLSAKWIREFQFNKGAFISAESESEIKTIIAIMGRNAFVEYLFNYSNRDFQKFISNTFRRI